jgi:hypothetical protein
VLGDHEVAIEVNATSQANNRHLKGLNSFADGLISIPLFLADYTARFIDMALSAES